MPKVRRATGKLPASQARFFADALVYLAESSEDILSNQSALCSAARRRRVPDGASAASR